MSTGTRTQPLYTAANARAAADAIDLMDDGQDDAAEQTLANAGLSDLGMTDLRVLAILAPPLNAF